ncbi:MAG: 2-succinyl-5-enolpyruvyl-6-hydroxy-3-cyclohexene-1-carboxylic-acid synthase, partial [Chlorobi bacterium]|nr:2-succinyl-5-enolpyruvyl-6-hydroxy-3-cyclohexene-1-carboxylic-acid synthase [Chlorobiota bacterium]
MKPQINHNIFWAETTVKLLASLGVKNAVISPGSRSAPFVFAFSKSKKIKKTVVIDERDNGFFALGLAKASGVPTAIVTTSGTAVAELYPAVIEAFNSRTPLIVITSDRPEYLYGTGANQTINQIDIYKNHIRKFFDFDVTKPNKKKIAKLKKDVFDAFETASVKDAGPVHLNFHFEKPFEPESFTTTISNELRSLAFSNERKINNARKKGGQNRSSALAGKIAKCENGIILVGGGRYSKEDIQSVLKFSELVKYPIFADGTSPFRFLPRKRKNIFVNQTAFLKSRKINPEIIIQFGTAPTSNVLLSFFKESKAEKFVVNPFGDLNDPSRTATSIIRAGFSDFAEEIIVNLKCLNFKRIGSGWLNRLAQIEKTAGELKEEIIENASFPFEGKVIIELMKSIPSGSNL